MASPEKSERFNTINHAKRLHEIGELFLELESKERKSEKSFNIFHISIPDDAKFPELIEPDPNDEYDKANREYNLLADMMPTSIMNESYYSVKRGEKAEEILIIVRNRRIDLGYKVPEMEFPNNEEAANFLFEKYKNLRNRSDKERQEAEGRRLQRETLLSDESKVFLLGPKLFNQNKLQIIQQDHITGIQTSLDLNLENFEQIGSDIINLLLTVQFNLLSEVKSRLSNDKIPNELRPKAVAIFTDYFEGQIPEWLK